MFSLLDDATPLVVTKDEVSFIVQESSSGDERGLGIRARGACCSPDISFLCFMLRLTMGDKFVLFLLSL